MLVICFGRPGAGKTTISSKALELLLSNGIKGTCIDLDVCVPQFMKENFAKGIYPTLEQRNAFALVACDYVKKLEEKNGKDDPVIVTFSFVNTDLRNTFQSNFPDATWVLIDVTVETAQSRINQREGHFYKGKMNSEIPSELNESHEVDDSDWDFAPVNFDHIYINGLNSVQENAQTLVNVLLSRDTF